MRQAALPAPDSVERALARVLARPEFQERRPSGPLVWLARQYDALGEWLGELLRGLGVADAAAPLVAWIALALLAACAALLLFHFGRALLRRARRSPGLAGSAPAPAEPAGADWAQRAQSLAGAGRFREAVLATYQLVLERLERRGGLRVDPVKTPGDYRRELRASGAPVRSFDEFLRRFEPAAFGGREPDHAAFERVWRLGEEVARE